MLFIGEIAIADSDAELLEMIQRFEEDEECKTLLIIDTYNRIENIKELRATAESDCFVVFLQPGHTHTEARKGIYINDKFDLVAQDFMREHWAMLVFYN